MPIDPGTAAVVSAGISAGGSIIGGMMSKEGGLSEGQKWIQAHPVQTIVNDARLAGVHPLYALGNVATPTQTAIPGQYAKGSAIADAADAMAKGVTNYANAKNQKQDPTVAAQVKALDASAERDFAAAMEHWSNVRMADLNYVNALAPPVIPTGETKRGWITINGKEYPVSHVQYYDVVDGQLKWSPNYQELGWEAPETVGALQEVRGRLGGRHTGQPRQYPPPQPKTPRGTYDFRNFPIR